MGKQDPSTISVSNVVCLSLFCPPADVGEDRDIRYPLRIAERWLLQIAVGEQNNLIMHLAVVDIPDIAFPSCIPAREIVCSAVLSLSTRVGWYDFTLAVTL